MQTFTQSLSASAYTEILSGGTFLSFDVASQHPVEIVFTQTAAVPAADTLGTQISSWPEKWDFDQSGLAAGTQRIWAKGDNSITGVRGFDTQKVSLDPLAFDIFGRLRTSETTTLFDSKQLFDNMPLFWDDQELSGSGTTTVHNALRASTTLGVAATTAGRRMRRTFQRFNYQPGKAQFIEATGVLSITGGSGITAGMGYCDDNNGVFVEVIDGVIGMTIRSNATGTPVDDRIIQSAWNGDKLDGTGPSGLTLDASKSQLWWCDMTWLGVGPVRTGFLIGTERIVCHTFSQHCNVLDVVYMSTPNLPVSYWIENDGTGAASSLEHICSSVMSEGGKDPTGQLHWHDTDGAHVVATAAGTKYAVLGMRLKAGHIGLTVNVTKVGMLAKTNDNLVWTLEFNPTVAGTFTYADHPNSGIQTAEGVTANTVTGGHEMAGGFIAASKDGGSGGEPIDNALRLGSAIDGTVDEVVLCVRSFGASAQVEGGLAWRELA